jgi:hypothetical protein
LPTVNNIEITQVDQYKYLGLIIDPNLKWTLHINSIMKKIAPIIGILWRTRHATTVSMRRKIYYALIHSHLNYLCPVWGNTYACHLKPLKVLQNKAIKIIHNYEWRKNTKEIYAKSGILCFDNIVEKNLAIYMYQIKNKLIKNNIEITINNQLHSYPTSSSLNIHSNAVRTNMGHQSTLNRATIVWNKLPRPIKEINNLNSFKSAINEHLLGKQITEYNNSMVLYR